MSDGEKVCRYSDLQWDDDTPVNADKNTLKQLGEALQRKQEVNYRPLNDDLEHFMNDYPKMNRCDSKQQKDLIKLTKNCSVDFTKKNKNLETSMNKYLDGNIISTPNQRLIKLQILKKNNTNDNYFREQLTERLYDHSERRGNDIYTSKYALQNSKNSLFEKLKQLNQNTSNDNQEDFQSMIEEEKQYDHLKERQHQNGNLSQTDYMISARERSQHNLLNSQKQRAEEYSANVEKTMQAEATSEFKKKVNQVVNQKNKDFIKQFTRMKNENKSKQSEIYQKIIEFYQQKQKIDPNEIQLYQDIYNNHQKIARDLFQQIKGNNSNSSTNNNNQNNATSSKQDLQINKYQVLNNTLQSKPIRVSLSAQSNRRKNMESQQLSKQSTQESRKRFNTQVTAFDVKDYKETNSSQQLLEVPKQQQPSLVQQLTQSKGHSNSVYNMKPPTAIQNNLQIIDQLNNGNNGGEQSFNDYELLMQQNNNHYDHLMNMRLNRRILSTLRMQKDQKEQMNNQPFKHSNPNGSYTQAFNAPISTEHRASKQNMETQTQFTQKIRSKTKSPIKINRTTVVDYYQIANKPLNIPPNRSSSNSPIEFKLKINNKPVAYDNAEQDSPKDTQIDKIQRLQLRQYRKNGSSKHVSNSHSFLVNMFQNQKKSAEFQNMPLLNSNQNYTQNSARNKQQQQIVIIKDKGENEMQVKSSPTSVKNNAQFQQDMPSFNLFKQIQTQNTQNQRFKQRQQNQIDPQGGYDQMGVNSTLIKQNYSLSNNKMGSLIRAKLPNKETNVTSLSSKLFTKIKERIFMN